MQQDKNEDYESMSAAEFSRASRTNWHRSHHNYLMSYQMMLIEQNG